MKKKIIKSALLLMFFVLIVFAVVNTYKWIVCGEQTIKISTSSKAYTNSELYLSVIAQEKGVDLETKTKIKLLDSKGKKVKDVEVSYDGNNAIIEVPEIEAGNYTIEAKVSSKAGKDTVQKEIYISNGKVENVTITLDKGIYKPGDTVNFRVLLTDREKDEPVEKETNICIYDGNDNKVYNENVKTSDYGIVSGSFTLANEVNSGIYKLAVKTDANETTKQFKVNPYIMPKYEIKIGFDKQNYLVGDTAIININSNYFFGEAVSNAKYTIYINDKEYQTVTADTNGNATINYEIKEAKTYTIKVEAVDSSNYFVEESNNFVAGTDLFEVELLPEYGSLVAGEKNDVYVFTKNADGTPIKTYVTISLDNYTKQVATDENGIGKFSIDIDSIKNTTYNKTTKTFKIVAENMNGDKVRKDISLNVENKKILLFTDKVKYNQGEDIEINVSSDLENTKNIYFFKNDKLIKMLSTESLETSVNLEDIYGLIDIYVTENGNTTYYTTTSNSYQRTIFIKPEKALNIDINTDKQEYKPGENISISFETTDENNNAVEAALLVSMLDNSILSLADNDLSIDNIKIALSDLNFSNEIDGATLYSCIIDETSEQTMMALLLKQSGKDVKISETTMKNYDEEEKSAMIAVISIALIIVMIFAYLCKKFDKFRNVMKHVLTCIIFNLTVIILSICIIEEFFWRTIDYSWWILGITVVVCSSIYIAWFSKLNKKMFRTSISILILLITLYVLAILIEIFEIPAQIFLVVVAAIILILAIISKIDEARKNRVISRILEESVYICKFIGALIVSIVIGMIIQKITDIDGIVMPISIIGVYFFNYFFNKIGKEEQNEEVKLPAKEDIITYIVIALAIVGLLTVGYLMISVYNKDSETVNSAGSARRN